MSAPADGSDRNFEAPDLIEVMEEAVRYNRFLVGSIADWSEGASRLLDFGAGNGRFARAMAERGHRVFAVEPDPALRRSIAAAGVEARESLDAFDPALRFDGIYSVNVLEHVEDDASLVRAFRERLVPGGRLYAYVPAFQVLYSANDARVGHVRRYGRRALLALARDAGFVDVRARFVDSLGFPAGLWYRWFGNEDGGLDVGAVRLYDRLVFPVSRALDRIAQRFVGKNLLLTARRPRQ
ncbi:MAG: class I SAM-dependent methyltransferase [Myxococcota bacterium]